MKKVKNLMTLKMKDITNDRIPEFDELVREYNEWLANYANEELKDSLFRRVLKSLTSVIGIFGRDYQFETSSETRFMFSGYDLTPTQIDAVKLGSDFRRAINTLDKIISGETEERKISNEDAKDGRRRLEVIYEGYRDIYI